MSASYKHINILNKHCCQHNIKFRNVSLHTEYHAFCFAPGLHITGVEKYFNGCFCDMRLKA